MASFIAFFATCFAAGLGTTIVLVPDEFGALWVGLGAGGVVGLIVFVLLVRRLWPRKG